ncbi:recombinase family protein [Vibrio parahaemolyticus]|nr:recombinase family protein [Vibrio parahaemolyticus]EHU0344279.1 recombinase family protein [Vibrio parahaemolyticus]EHU0354313.1 recombinase family protein [Vibrio parahaemolyticus]
MPSKLYSYQRCSMPSQIKGDSVRRQTSFAREYALQHNLEFQDKAFSDLGVSGWKSRRRSGLESLLQAIENNEIKANDVIFIENLDRLTRKGFQETNDLIKAIVSHGVILHVQSDSLTLNKQSLNDFTSIIRVAIMADLAFKESQKKSERLSEVKAQKRKRAIEDNEAQARKLPFWISYEKETKSYAFNEHVETVKLICKMRLEGQSDGKICLFLNEQGITTIRNRPWHESSVRNVYKHPAVYGAYQTMRSIRTDPDDHTSIKFIKDTLVPDHYPAVISKYEYENLNPTNAKRGAQSNHNHLKRLVKCGHCGNALAKKKTITKGVEYIQYYCIGTKQGSMICTCPPIKDLHKIVFDMTSRLKLRKPSTVKEDQQSVINEIDKKRSTLAQLQEAILSGVNVATLIQTSQTLETQIKELESKLAIEDATEEDFNHLRELQDNAVEWNYLATRLIKDIVLYNRVEPTRLGMGKTIGNWHVVIEQTNGYKINGALFGNDTTNLEEIFYMYDDTELIDTYENE